MRQMLDSHADMLPPTAEKPSTEHNERLQAWVDEHLRTRAALWVAMAQVLSAAIQMDLETPSWCRCAPGGEALSQAIDAVIEALPPTAIAAFDKVQGA